MASTNRKTLKIVILGDSGYVLLACFRFRFRVRVHACARVLQRLVDVRGDK